MRVVLPSSWRGWLMVLALSALGHVLALLLLDRGLAPLRSSNPDGPWLQAEVAKPPAPVLQPKPAPKPLVAPARRAPALPAPTPDVAALPPPEPITNEPVLPTPVAPATAPPVAAAPPIADVAPEGPPAENADTSPPTIDPPPAGTLSFKAVAVEGERRYYGSGELRWLPSDGRYRIEQTLGLDVIFTSIQLQQSVSEGKLHDQGLDPVRYTESRRGKAAVATNFNRDDRRSITFSASNRVIPLEANAQDRASVLLALASRLRATAGATPPGQFEVLLAGVRDAERWVFVFQGEEVVDVPSGPTTTLHYARLPSPGSRERQVDVWFAAALDGMPAKIRYTEQNGNTLELITQRFARTEGGEP